MIVFDLICDADHRFEGWFGSSQSYAEQSERGLLACPRCGSEAISKAPMAPAVAAKGNRAIATPDVKTQPVVNGELPAAVKQAMSALAEAQSKALKDSTWVGDKFAEHSRAMHYGERDEQAIHGKATANEAKGLIDEGIAVAPLPFPIAEPGELN